MAAACCVLLLLSGCAEQREQRRGIETAVASMKVIDIHGCKESEGLASLRDYDKQKWCAICRAGHPSVALADGGSIEACSACGSGDVVFKLSAKERATACTDLANMEQIEQKEGFSDDMQYTLLYGQAEVEYMCRAGNQDSCNDIQKESEDQRTALMKEQTRAMRQTAFANLLQAQAAQQANHQSYMITPPGQMPTFVRPVP